MPIKKSINKLSNAHVFALYGHVQTKYVESQQSDEEFAIAATTALGFEVNGANVQNARQQLGIGMAPRATKPTVEVLLARIVTLEERVSGVEARNAELLQRMTQKGLTELVDREYGPGPGAGILVVEVVGKQPKPAHTNGRGR